MEKHEFLIISAIVFAFITFFLISSTTEQPFYRRIGDYTTTVTTTSPTDTVTTTITTTVTSTFYTTTTTLTSSTTSTTSTQSATTSTQTSTTETTTTFTTTTGSTEIFEYYNTGDDNYALVYGANWVAQSFTTGSSPHTVNQVKIKAFRVGSPGTLTLSIRATDGSGHPTGSDLTSGTIDANTFTTSTAGVWYTIAVTEYGLSANTKYAIVVCATSGSVSNYVGWRGDSTSPTYSGGCTESSEDAGASWTSHEDWDMMFEVWGRALTSTSSSTIVTTITSSTTSTTTFSTTTSTSCSTAPTETTTITTMITTTTTHNTYSTYVTTVPQIVVYTTTITYTTTSGVDTSTITVTSTFCTTSKSTLNVTTTETTTSSSTSKVTSSITTVITTPTTSSMTTSTTSTTTISSCSTYYTTTTTKSTTSVSTTETLTNTEISGWETTTTDTYTVTYYSATSTTTLCCSTFSTRTTTITITPWGYDTTITTTIVSSSLTTTSATSCTTTYTTTCTTTCYWTTYIVTTEDFTTEWTTSATSSTTSETSSTTTISTSTSCISVTTSITTAVFTTWTTTTTSSQTELVTRWTTTITTGSATSTTTVTTTITASTDTTYTTTYCVSTYSLTTTSSTITSPATTSMFTSATTTTSSSTSHSTYSTSVTTTLTTTSTNSTSVATLTYTTTFSTTTSSTTTPTTTVTSTSTSFATSTITTTSTGTASFTIIIEVSITDMEGCGNWVFAEEKYYTFLLNVTNPNGVGDIDFLQINFSDGYNTIVLGYDNEQDSYVLVNGEDVVSMARGTATKTGNNTVLTVTWKVYFKSGIFDAYNIDTYARYNTTAGYLFYDTGWLLMQEDYFNIYNLGGQSSMVTSGTAGRLVGGDYFSLYAQGLSSVQANMTWRKLQWWGMMVAINWTDVSNNPVTNAGYVEFGMYYCIDDNWVKGWKARLEVTDRDNGVNDCWNEIRVKWYRGEGDVWVLKNTQYIYCFYEGHQARTEDVIRFWVDFWFNRENASTTCGGRITTYYYPMHQGGFGIWGTWDRWQGPAANTSHIVRHWSDYFMALLDYDENIASAARITMMKAFVLVNSTDANYGIRLKEIGSLKYQITKEDMEGIHTPDYISPTVVSGVASGWWAWLGVMLSSTIAPVLTTAALAAWTVFVAFLDTIAGWLGYPGAFSTFIVWLVQLWTFLSSSFTYLITLLTGIFNLISGPFVLLFTMIAQFFSGLVTLATYIGQILTGQIPGTELVPILINQLPWQSIFLIGVIMWVIHLADIGPTKAWGEINIVTNILTFFIDIAWKVIRLFLDIIGRIIESIPVVE